ncbi:ribonuclease H2 subunit B-like [Vespa mandarinia]|uniref:ribonuclease H2 subunit B-like n=1 Tax=Vespa mandarinia TaxID=7446 RepID=UPI001618BE44|nr:ribonuclease H2 subunit B-like [Vespa mandarinia]XP_046820588.1 ribonuclease H2 subunit B [Vespa crabro]XP_047348984.1 ribonuclease H2 subunit B [Vespa velutina]
MPRIKASPKKCVKTGNLNPATNTWVFLMKGDGLEGKDGNLPNVVKLRHPASNQPAMFVFSPGDLMVQEVLAFDENRRSWFIDDNVKSDGKMHLSTPIDPIFLVLPYLRKSPQIQPLDQCLWDEDYPETPRLAHCQNLKLSLVADRKGDESLQAFKYNEEKTLNWLKKKVERVAEVLKQKSIHVSQGAISATYVKSTKYESGTELEYLKYAHGIVSEYLADDIAKKLLQYLNIPEEVERKRKLSNPKQVTDEKKFKRDTSDEDLTPRTKALDLSKPEKPQKAPTLNKKELARQKAAVGSKNITSFFKKK